MLEFSRADDIINFDGLVKAGMISSGDLSLFRFAETSEDLCLRLVEGGVRPGAEPPWPMAADVHR